MIDSNDEAGEEGEVYRRKLKDGDVMPRRAKVDENDYTNYIKTDIKVPDFVYWRIMGMDLEVVPKKPRDDWSFFRSNTMADYPREMEGKDYIEPEFKWAHSLESYKLEKLVIMNSALHSEHVKTMVLAFYTAHMEFHGKFHRNIMARRFALGDHSNIRRTNRGRDDRPQEYERQFDAYEKEKHAIGKLEFVTTTNMVSQKAHEFKALVEEMVSTEVVVRVEVEETFGEISKPVKLSEAKTHQQRIAAGF
jgi:hypothetical protein